MLEAEQTKAKATTQWGMVGRHVVNHDQGLESGSSVTLTRTGFGRTQNPTMNLPSRRLDLIVRSAGGTR